MSSKPLTRENFNKEVKRLREQIGEGSKNIDFTRAYSGYLLVAKIFGEVNLAITKWPNGKKIEFVPVKKGP